MEALLSKSPLLSDLKSHLHSTHTSPKLSDLTEHLHHSHHGSPDLSHVTAVTLPPVEEYKIALIGDTGSGKSSIMIRFIYDIFEEHQKWDATVSDIESKKVDLDGIPCKITLLDTGASAFPQNSSTEQKWICESDAAIIVFSVTHSPWASTPAAAIKKHYEKIQGVRKKQDPDYKEENYPVLILGTKNDRVEDRVIEVGDGIKVAEELGVEYAECSSKELGGGVDKLVLDLVRDVRESRVDEEVDSEVEEKSKGMRKRGDTWGSFIEVLEKIGSEHQK